MLIEIEPYKETKEQIDADTVRLMRAGGGQYGYIIRDANGRIQIQVDGTLIIESISANRIMVSVKSN